MIRKKFGKNGPEVTLTGFGAGHIGNEKQDEKDIERLLNEVLDLGINLIDTARAYGLSERRIGKYISRRRSEYVLSSKVGYDVPGKRDWSYDAVYDGIEQALTLLRTDYIDVVHLHSCSRQILEQGDVILALERAKKEGKIRLMAYSGENEALDYALGTGKFDSIQTSVNFCDQRGIGKFLPKAMDSELGVIAKRPLANAPWRESSALVGHNSEEYLRRFQKMDPGISGEEMADIAIRFSAYSPGVSSCIIGSANIEHIRAAARSTEKGPPDAAIRTFLEKKFSENDDNWVGLI